MVLPTVKRRKQKTRKGTKSYRKKASRARKSRVAKTKVRKTRARKQKGGAAHIPDDRYPEGSVVIVQDADGDGGGPVMASLDLAEKELIAASDRPADPYDEQAPGDEPE